LADHGAYLSLCLRHRARFTFCEVQKVVGRSKQFTPTIGKLLSVARFLTEGRNRRRLTAIRFRFDCRALKDNRRLPNIGYLLPE
jgi:hypothetical protein